MAEIITRQGLVRICIMVAALVVVLLVYYPHSPGARERDLVKKGLTHEALIRQKLSGDLRFRNVIVRTYAGDDQVALALGGTVDSTQDWASLQELVTATRPPLPVTNVVGIAWLNNLPVTVIRESSDSTNGSTTLSNANTTLWYPGT